MIARPVPQRASRPTISRHLDAEASYRTLARVRCLPLASREHYAAMAERRAQQARELMEDESNFTPTVSAPTEAEVAATEPRWIKTVVALAWVAVLLGLLLGEGLMRGGWLP